jgi:hypothetical protein
MKKIIFQLLPSFLQNRILHIQKQAYNFYILSCKYGQWATIRDLSSKNSSNEEIPWYTYPAIEYLAHLDLSKFRVLEFGSGNSTIWWSKNALSIASIEDNPDWHNYVVKKITNLSCSAECILKPSQWEYVHSFKDCYEIVVVDGKFRPECIDEFLLNPHKIIILIFDNSDRYPLSIQKIRDELGWVELDFHGFGPINMYTWTTTIFINPLEAKKIAYKNSLGSVAALKICAE